MTSTPNNYVSNYLNSYSKQIFKEEDAYDLSFFANIIRGYYNCVQNQFIKGDRQYENELAISDYGTFNDYIDDCKEFVVKIWCKLQPSTKRQAYQELTESFPDVIF